MAITVLGQGNSGAIVSPASFSQAVPLPAGSSRLLLVAVLGHAQTPPTISGFPVPTYGGIALPVTFDGAATGGATVLSAGGLFRVALFWFLMREQELTSAPNNTLAVVWPPTATVWRFLTAWWFIGGAEQPAAAVPLPGTSVNLFDAKANVSNNTGATSLSATMDANATDDAIFVAGIDNSLSGQNDLSIGGVGITEDVQLTLTGGIGHVAAGKQIPAGSAGALGIASAFVASIAQGAVLGGLRIRAAVAPTPGQAVLTYREPWSVAAEWTQ